ncbi:MAG: class I SAM-dependent methyltransferase [candidate division NC10 bacterium]|nr:class I SAM-dependent methyltransferase [candidate division NC10 bacterium]
MGISHPVFAALYDWLTWPAERGALGRRRAALVAEGRGRILDLGAGTGLNLPRLRAAQRYVGVEPDPAMLEQARPRAAAATVPAALLLGRGEALPFPDGAFDTVLATLVFCTVPNIPAALAEVRRVLRPGGALLFLEHVRSPRRPLGALQDALTPLWRRCFGGCHPNRDTLNAFRDAGFALEVAERWAGGRWVRGAARPE